MLGTTRFVCDRPSNHSISVDCVRGVNEEDAPLRELLGYPLQLFNNMRNVGKSARPGSRSTSAKCQEIELKPVQRALTFCELPVPVRWLIFSYLDSRSLCAAATVSTSWFHLAGDELLWRRLMKYDMPKWELVSHLAHPTLFKEVVSDLSTKEIYLRCHPSRQQRSANHSLFSWHLPFRLPRWFRHPSRIAVFGPGLDTMPLISKVVFNPDAPYKPTGMVPGSDGVGSGICIRHAEYNINLITLFSATKEERRNAGAVNRLVRASNQNDDDDEDEDDVAEVSFHVQELCKTIDAFVCVVDASAPVDKGVRKLVHAMVGQRSQCKPSSPLLVYAATSSQGNQKVSCVQLADDLQLTKLCRPWQVRSLNMEDLSPIGSGFDWLLPQCHA